MCSSRITRAVITLMPSILTPKLSAEVENLEAEYEALSQQIDRSGGVDYRGKLAALRKELETKRRELYRWSKLWRAVESDNRRETADTVVEVLLGDEDTDTLQGLAADYIEDEVGRFDWVRNWETIRRREDPVAKVQAYLDTYDIAADAQEIVDYIDLMAATHPGRWK